MQRGSWSSNDLSGLQQGWKTKSKLCIHRVLLLYQLLRPSTLYQRSNQLNGNFNATFDGSIIGFNGNVEKHHPPLLVFPSQMCHARIIYEIAQVPACVFGDPDILGLGLLASLRSNMEAGTYWQRDPPPLPNVINIRRRQKLFWQSMPNPLVTLLFLPLSIS